MDIRALRETGRRSRRARLLLTTTTIALIVALLFPGGSLASVFPSAVFELDGNATNDAAAGADWDTVYSAVTAQSLPTGASAAAFDSDGSLNATIFTGGGSKDPIDIDQWAWKDGAGGLPDKDNLLHAFAVRYGNLLFFGSDRYDNSGDAQQGFWFFQNAIALGNTPVGGGSSFTGVHENGDLLVISDFSNGGTTATITVYEWNSSVSGNLELVASSDNAKCTGTTSKDVCGIVNPTNDTATGGWSFTDKSGNTTYLQGEFYEGGIDLAAFDLGGKCFASFAAETRSSTSTTATLKDFVLGGFGSCTSGLTTTPKDGSGNAIPTGGLTMGSGSVTATDSATLTVTGTTTWTGTLAFYLCGPLTSGTCDGTINTGTQVGTSITVDQSTTQPILSSAATITSPGTYCWRATFTSGTTDVPSASDSRSSECFTVSKIQPAMTSRQFVYPQDKVTVTATEGNLSGTAYFQLYDTAANCAAGTTTGQLYSTSATISGASPQSGATANTTYAVTTSTTVYWRVWYTSTNVGQSDIAATCTENTQLTYTGNDTTITVP